LLGQKKRHQVCERIASIGRSRYGDLSRRKIRPPLDQLVLSTLWRYTSVRRGTRALRQLKRVFVDWNEVRISPAGEVAAAISTAAWAPLAAEHIKKILDSLLETRNVVSLEFLSEFTPAQARAFLQSLQGVSRDLADEVHLLSLRRAVLPLSDDAARMSYRLGLICSERPTLDNQRVLSHLWKPKLYPSVALFFNDFARDVCRRIDPLHETCPLKDLCPEARL